MPTWNAHAVAEITGSFGTGRYAYTTKTVEECVIAHRVLYSYGSSIDFGQLLNFAVKRNSFCFSAIRLRVRTITLPSYGGKRP